MRGTSIFSLPGLLIGAALRTTEAAKAKPHKSLCWRVRYQYLMWRMDYSITHDTHKCRKITREDLQSFERFKEAMK